ncbi:MAG: hypothetical protein ICV65_17395 [Flavisolibacter sp.]|nr:hypothetical protein [Flavisolibacter sp.]
MQQKAPKPLIIGMLASLATGLLALFFFKKKADQKSNIARKAPQLHLNNPGIQDDFPKPPTESEIG